MQLHLSMPGRRDPWWGLDGPSARRHRARVMIESGLAFLMALGAFCFMVALWVSAVALWTHA